MKAAIIYTTKHGTTLKVASMINEMASGKADLIDLKKTTTVNFDLYDKIIIGGSIHAGKIQRRVVKFCEKNMKELSDKPLGLYLSCMDEEKAQEQFNNAYPETLRNHALSSKLTGGEVLFERMNFLEKYIMKKIGKRTESISNIKEDKVRELALEMGLLNN